jgi:hypothetical protein
MNKKLWVSIGLAVTLCVGGILGFVAIPYWMGMFRAASAIPKPLSVSGNGGGAVMAGEYLFFVDGYKSLEEYKFGENEYNNVRANGGGAIWRVKMVDGKPAYNNNYLENYLRENNVPEWERYLNPDDNLSDDEIDAAKNMVVAGKGKDGNLELIVPKIAGWEKTAIWIFGNSLIYTSPNHEQSRTGKLQNHIIDFFTCNLRGENHKKFYTTTTEDLEKTDFTMVWAGEPFLLVHDGKKDDEGNTVRNLLRVDLKGAVKKIADKVDTFIFPVVTGYYVDLAGSAIADDRNSLENSYSGIMQNVYYTTAVDTEKETIKTGNKLWRFNYSTKANDRVGISGDQFDLKAFGNGHLIFELKEADAIDAVLCIADSSNTGLIYGGLTKMNFSATQLEYTAIYVSRERCDAFRFLGLKGTTLYVWNPEIKGMHVAKVESVNEVFTVNESCVVFKTGEDTYAEQNYISTNANSELNVSGRSINVNSEIGLVAYFRVLSANGMRTGDTMLFQVKTFTEILTEVEATQDAEENAVTPTASQRVGMITSFSGNGSFVLVRLDTEKFVKMPTAILPKTE